MPKGIPNVRASIKTSDADIRESSTLDLREDNQPEIAIVTDESLMSPNVAEYVKDLKFNEDILTIVISETGDPNAENPVPTACNGETKLLVRGKEYKLARKFVDSLIKVEERIKTINFRDAEGLDQTKISKTPALKYPMSIINDPAGELGRRWFMHQCKNAW